jgi:putative transposase
MHVHLVFVTKYRRHVLDSAGTDALRTMFTTICEDFGANLRACDGEDDHVHLLVEYPPSVAISKLVNSLQGVSSRRLRQQRPDIARRYWNGVLWSPFYFAASCGGAPLDIIRRYVEQQRNTG